MQSDGGRVKRVVLLLTLCGAAYSQMLGSHQAVRDASGHLQPWSNWSNILDREMNWYLNCPLEHGYPRFVWMTFMDGNYQPVERRHDFIPAMQNGMGIISYLKYYEYKGRKNPKVLEWARYMGDYLVKEANTPDEGKYPRFTRSTGKRAAFPQPPDAGSQDDRPYEIQPDKGGIAGYALALLFESTKDKRYLDQALQNARVLVSNMEKGYSTRSPWPFRADYRTGEARGAVSGNMTYILRLFDKLIDLGYPEFRPAREQLWAWIKNYQLPNLSKDALLWAQFFEDHTSITNRTAWSPLALARYLLEKKDALDPDWQKDARALIEFVNKHYVSLWFGVAACGEQDEDRDPWGGINSTWAATLAIYSAVTGSVEYKTTAREAMTLALYAVDDDGCPRDTLLHSVRGGWQEDAHTDKIHNVVDALRAFPEWAR
jgi:hypothetical protein